MIKKKWYRYLLLIGIFIFVSIVWVSKDSIYDILNVNISNTEEYVDYPRTLNEWQTINPNVVMILEFTSNGILHNIPVLEVENGDKYMKRNPWGDYDTMGSVFMEKEISPFKGSNNWLINGHSSFNKDWNFTFLKNYVKQEYLNKHSTFQVELKDGFHTYRILSFAEYDLELNEDTIYMGWYNNNFTVDEGISMIKETLPYLLTSNPGLQYQGQQMMTLITCNMKKKDSRYVLMAIEIEMAR
ncbi:MAG: class B sortase [Longicatena sp.]